jgi:hypothetical protein
MSPAAPETTKTRVRSASIGGGETDSRMNSCSREERERALVARDIW